MKVLLLGAGASKGAGYPLASQLLASIEADVASSPAAQPRDAWREWRAFRDGMTGPLQLILRNPNPEVILSLLDLYEAALSAHDREQLEAAARALRKGTAGGDIEQSAYWDTPEREALFQGKVARNRLLDCLSEYFEAKHYDDGKPEHWGRRGALRRLLTTLEPGDAVVTLNYDTSVERTLAEEGRWHPTTGYGFTKELCIGTSPPEADVPCRIAPPQASDVSVLKLHGSTGWYSNRRGETYFRHASYFQCFSFETLLVDPQEPPPGSGPPEDPVLLYPSYLKQVKGQEMQAVWHEAARAFASARQVQICGYSLPESDTAVRVLLNPLRFRLDEGVVQVVVRDPSETVHARWREFLGPRVEIDNRPL